jgi:trans-aconitate methyltransferase
MSAAARHFDPAWFDAAFWTTDEKGVLRDPDHPRYAVTARQVSHALAPRLGPFARLLEVGCGQGAVMLALAGRQPDWDIDGIDVSEYAVETRVHPHVIHGDVREMEVKAPYDAVLCIGVLEYLDPADVPKALLNLRDAARQYVVLGLQPTDHRHMTVEYARQSGRLTFADKAQWEAWMARARLEIIPTLTAALYDGVEGWDGIYGCGVKR